MFARGNPMSGAIGASSTAPQQALRPDAGIVAAPKQTEEHFAPWWLAGISESGFLTLWMAADLAIIGLTGLMSHWLGFGTADMSNAGATAVGLAVVVAWLAFRHFGVHSMHLASLPLTHLRLAAM